MSNYLKDMAAAYIEAAYFTDGEGEELGDAEFTTEFERAAYVACINFVWALDDLDNVSGEYNPAQLGHDLWLTRNGHGVGFWDRPEIYGEANAKIFSAMAKAQGTHDAEFIE